MPATRIQRNDSTQWDGATHPRSRRVIVGVMTVALAIYAGGIYWLGLDLADDVRSGMREVQSGVLIREVEG